MPDASFPLARGWRRAYRRWHERPRRLLVCRVVTSFPPVRRKRKSPSRKPVPLTTRDEAPKLFATSDERFRDAKPSPVKADTPAGWLALPASQFRLLNYRFGESGMGEVWVSISQGSVLDNVNRWLKQFGAESARCGRLWKNFRPSPLAGSHRRLGRRRRANTRVAWALPPKPGFALAGVVASIGGQILTVKMVGPKAEVEAARPVLETFAKSLRHGRMIRLPISYRDPLIDHGNPKHTPPKPPDPSPGKSSTCSPASGSRRSRCSCSGC